MDEAAINSALKACYEFDNADLEANRNGKLTVQQARMIQARTRVFKAAGGGLVGLAVLPLACGLPSAVVLWLVVHDWVSALGVTAASIAGFVALGGLGLRAVTRGETETHSAVLRNISGPVAIDTETVQSSRGHYTEYHMTIAGQRFVLEDELAETVTSGGTYALNYVDFQDGSEGLILSMECLTAPPAAAGG